MAKKKAQRRITSQSSASMAFAVHSSQKSAKRSAATSKTSLKALARHLLSGAAGLTATAGSLLGATGGGGDGRDAGTPPSMACTKPLSLEAVAGLPARRVTTGPSQPPSAATTSAKAGGCSVKKNKRKRKRRKSAGAHNDVATGYEQRGAASLGGSQAAATPPSSSDRRCSVSATSAASLGSSTKSSLTETTEKPRGHLTSAGSTDDHQPCKGASSRQPSIVGCCSQLEENCWIRKGAPIRVTTACSRENGSDGVCGSKHPGHGSCDVMLSVHEMAFPVALQGACQLRHVSGPALCLRGYVLQPGDSATWHDIYSPKLYPRLVLNIRHSRQSSDDGGEIATVPAALGSDDRWVTVAVKLSPKADALIRGFGLVYNRLLEVPSLPCRPDDCAELLVRLGGANAALPSLCLLDATRHKSELLVDPPAALLQSLEALDARATLPTILICGGKNAGKSTLTRYVVNNLLNKYDHVFYLDADPGQTEFTPPGCISLKKISNPIFGPPWTHVGDEDISVRFLGCLSPANDPDSYMECLRSLVGEYAVHRAGSVPLVVNTMGWVTGLGLDLLVATLHAVRPSLVVQISSSSSANKNLPPVVPSELPPQPPLFGSMATRQPCNEDAILSFVNCHLWSQEMGCANYSGQDTRESDCFSARSLGAPQCRDLMTLSYFCQPPWSPSIRCAADPAAFMNAAPPFAVPWDAVVVQLCGGTTVPARYVLGALNASMVVLATVDRFPPKAQDDGSGEPVVRLIDPDVVTSYVGFGFVRAIDVDKRLLYITTPVSRERLASVNCLRRGAGIELPEIVFTTQGTLAGRALPYVDIRRQGVGARSSQSMPRNFKIAGNTNRR